jgi:hypothetical protein
MSAPPSCETPEAPADDLAAAAHMAPSLADVFLDRPRSST